MELSGNVGCISSEPLMQTGSKLPKADMERRPQNYRYSQPAYAPQVVVLKDLLLVGPDCVKAWPVFLLLWRWQQYGLEISDLVAAIRYDYSLVATAAGHVLRNDWEW